MFKKHCILLLYSNTLIKPVYLSVGLRWLRHVEDLRTNVRLSTEISNQ